MDPLPLLRDLVAANSVNPSLVPGAPGEAEAAEVARRGDGGARASTSCCRKPRRDGPTSSACSKAARPGRRVMFCGHLDTVGVEGMTDPFVPRIEQRPALRRADRRT